MKRNLLVVAVATLLTGCLVENRSSIAILDRAAPSDANACTFAAGGQSLIGPGTLDIGHGDRSYGLAVYVDNNLVDPHATTPETVSGSKDWTVAAAKVRLNPREYVETFGASPPLLAIDLENVVPADGTTIPAAGKGVVGLEAVSTALGLKIAEAFGTSTPRTVVLGITLQGRTRDGARLDTGEWYFPLTICNGCIVNPDCGTKTFVPGSCFGTGQQDSAGTCE